MANKRPSVTKVAVFNMLSPIVLNGLAFATMPLFTRLLGTAQYGNYTNYISYYSILSVIIGFQAAGAIAPASVCYEGKERDRCFSNIMAMAVLSALIIGGLMLIFADPISAFTGIPKLMLGVLFLHAVGAFAVNFGTAKFSYDKNSAASFAVAVGISVVSIGLSLAFIYGFPSSVPRWESYTLAHAIPYLLAGVALVAMFMVRGKSFFDKKYWGFTLALCLPLIFHQLSNSLLHQCDKIMLKQLTTESIVGIYGFAVTFANILNVIWSALNTTFVPFYHDDVKSGNPEALNKKNRNYSFLFTCLACGFMMASPEVVKLFGAPDFWGAIDIIPILALGFYFVFLYSFPVNFEFYHRRTKTIAVGTCLAAVVNIVLNWVLIGCWGMMGAAVATAVSYLFLWIFHSILARVSIKDKYPFESKAQIIGLAIVLAFLGLFYVIKDLWLIRWGIFGVLGVALLIKVYKQKSIF